VLIGPSGVFVIDTKNWTGRITVDGGHLRQNGYSREKAVASAADAALAVSERVSPYAAWVHPVLCFVGQDNLAGWSREVAVCSTANLVQMLTSRPMVFTPEHVQYLHGRLQTELRSAHAQRSVMGPTGRLVWQDRAGSYATRSARSRGRSKSQGPFFGRFIVGIAMLIALVSVGPQLAAGIGGTVADRLTKDLGSQSCSPVPQPDADEASRATAKNGAKPRRHGKASTRAQAGTAQGPSTGTCSTQ
jgi:hypothetical protein